MSDARLQGFVALYRKEYGHNITEHEASDLLYAHRLPAYIETPTTADQPSTKQQATKEEITAFVEAYRRIQTELGDPQDTKTTSV